MAEIKSLKSRFVRLKKECLDRCVVERYDDDDNIIEGGKKLYQYYPNSKVGNNKLYYFSRDWKNGVFEVVSEYYGVSMRAKTRRAGSRDEFFDTDSVEPKHKIALSGFYEDLDKEAPYFFDADIFEVVKQQHYWVKDEQFNQ